MIDDIEKRVSRDQKISTLKRSLSDNNVLNNPYLKDEIENLLFKLEKERDKEIFKEDMEIIFSKILYYTFIFILIYLISHSIVSLIFHNYR